MSLFWFLVYLFRDQISQYLELGNFQVANINFITITNKLLEYILRSNA